MQTIPLGKEFGQEPQESSPELVRGRGCVLALLSVCKPALVNIIILASRNTL